jgi:WD40 repeat protein
LTVSSNDKAAKLWDAKTGKLLHIFTGHTDWVHSAEFSHDGMQVVTGSEDGTAKIWDVEAGKLLRTFAVNDGYVHCAVFSPDG